MSKGRVEVPQWYLSVLQLRYITTRDSVAMSAERTQFVAPASIMSRSFDSSFSPPAPTLLDRVAGDILDEGYKMGPEAEKASILRVIRLRAAQSNKDTVHLASLEEFRESIGAKIVATGAAELSTEAGALATEAAEFQQPSMEDYESIFGPSARDIKQDPWSTEAGALATEAAEQRV